MPLKRKRKTSPIRNSVARAVLEGACREEMVTRALAVLADAGGADRFGVWLRVGAAADSEAAGQTPFHGATAAPQRPMTPWDWSSLSADAPVPWDQLSAGKTISHQLASGAMPPALAPFTKFKALLWVPIHRSGRLFGIVLGGARASGAALPEERMESVATEVSLMLALESERENSRNQAIDAKLCTEVLSRLAEGDATVALPRIVENCTESTSAGGLGAHFAAIARTADFSQPSHDEPRALEFAWTSGPQEWFAALQSDDITRLGKEALRSGHAVGTESRLISAAQGTVLRVLAMPLLIRGTELGLLVAGLNPGQTSLAMLERLELRASCAAAALAAMGAREERDKRGASRIVVAGSGIPQQAWDARSSAELLALMGSLEDGAILYDAENRIRAMNPRFAELWGSLPN